MVNEIFTERTEVMSQVRCFHSAKVPWMLSHEDYGFSPLGGTTGTNLAVLMHIATSGHASSLLTPAATTLISIIGSITNKAWRSCSRLFSRFASPEFHLDPRDRALELES